MMKKTKMYILAAAAAALLVACVPTTQKNTDNREEKTTEETGPTEPLANSVVTDRPVDHSAPVMDVISIYTVKDDQSGLEGTMDSVESGELSAESLVELLIRYGALEEGTSIISYEATDPQATESFAGPGASAEDSHIIVLSSYIEEAELDLSAMPGDGKDELTVKAIARTFMENLNIQTFTLKLNGTVVGDRLTELDVE